MINVNMQEAYANPVVYEGVYLIVDAVSGAVTVQLYFSGSGVLGPLPSYYVELLESDPIFKGVNPITILGEYEPTQESFTVRVYIQMNLGGLSNKQGRDKADAIMTIIEQAIGIGDSEYSGRSGDDPVSYHYLFTSSDTSILKLVDLFFICKPSMGFGNILTRDDFDIELMRYYVPPGEGIWRVNRNPVFFILGWSENSLVWAIHASITFPNIIRAKIGQYYTVSLKEITFIRQIETSPHAYKSTVSIMAIQAPHRFSLTSFESLPSNMEMEGPMEYSSLSYYFFTKDITASHLSDLSISFKVEAPTADFTTPVVVAIVILVTVVVAWTFISRKKKSPKYSTYI
jgi:hypothetical protein